MRDYTDADATELARRLRDGEQSPAEVVDLAIAAIEQVEPRLHAVVHRMFDEARAAARGPLPDGPFRGVPMVVKDSDGFLGGQPYTAGTRLLERFVPDHDAEVFARLRRAGLIFVAKTNLPELALLATTENRWRGNTHNPWNTAHTPGGSSGGSAALVAARAVPVGHGGDGGGSLRIPASACGLVGLKVTRGRIPLGPDLGEDWGGYVQRGLLTRSVRDSAALLDVMAGPMPGDPYAAPPPARPFAQEPGADPGRLRVGLCVESILGRGTHPHCREAAEQAARLLQTLGHEVDEVRLPIDKERLARAYLTQVAVSVAVDVDRMGRWVGRTPSPRDFEPTTWFLVQVGRALGGVELQQARDAVQEAGRAMARFHERHDLFLGPTLAYPPIRLGELAPKPAERLGLAVLRAVPVKAALRAVLDRLAAESLERTPNTMLFNQTGQPAISLPLFWSPEHLPIGVQLAARFGEEALLLRVAAQLEAARPWAGRRPPVCAG
jgi:amidase